MIDWDGGMIEEYVRWHWDQVATKDLDPMYPWLRAYTCLAGCNQEQAAALTLTYLTWYNARSAILAWEQADRRLPSASKVPSLPTGTERRAHRSMAKLIQHLDDLNKHVDKAGGAYAWLTDADSWEAMTDRVVAVHGNGRWAAYKACDLASKVHDAPYVAPDAGHANSSGPRRALQLLGLVDPGGNSPEVIKYLDDATRELSKIVGDSDLSQIETSLCDFRSHVLGRHALGHDNLVLALQVQDLPHGFQAVVNSGIALVAHE